MASYTSVKWTGNLESRPINITTGVTSETANWCVETIPASTCAAPGALVTDSSGSSTVYNCVVSSSTAATCTSPGIFDSSTSKCSTEIQNTCSGTMKAKIGPTSVAGSTCLNNPNCDTRNIYTAPIGSLTKITSQNLVNFNSTYATADTVNFSIAHINGMNQWGSLTTTQQTAAADNLINYLRGQIGYEDRASNTALNRLYRAREATLGDALESQPTFSSKPVFSYPYPGYSDYKTAQASRAGTVFLGANDGMMHAFATSDGVERWAYVPSMIIPNMWKLASSSYDSNHANFVNGSPIISDVCTANCTNTSAPLPVWKTILVGGLNAGGRGYYALDITNPSAPILLWEITPTSGIGTVKDDDVGYSYGKPIIARKADGTWVVLVTSGYNNTSPGSGRGYLYVLNANTGAIISKIHTIAGSTSVGDTTTPSGLAKIAGFNVDPVGNTVGFVYGGDLLGNLWRFDINSANNALGSGSSGKGDVMRVAKLKDGAGTVQPITTTPVLGLISSKPVIFVGTGKYLEAGDLTTTQQQTQYAISDISLVGTVGDAGVLDNPAGLGGVDTVTGGVVTAVNRTGSVLVEQNITPISGTANRTATSSITNAFDTGRGWFIDFPATAIAGATERVNIDSQLVLGTLIIPTIVPTNSVCSPGGVGWLNFIDFKTGGAVTANNTSNIVSSSYNNPIVGFNVIYIDGKPKVSVVTSDNPTPELDPRVPFKPTSANFTGKRTLWRELIQ